MGHLGFMDWVVEMQKEEESFYIAVQEYTYLALLVEADWMAVALGQQPNGLYLCST